MSETPVGQLAEDLAYPAFNPAFVPIEVDRNTIEICIGPWTGPSYTVHDADGDGVIADILDGIDGETHVETLLEPVEEADHEEVTQFLRTLADEAVVYDAADRDPGAWAHLRLRDQFDQSERQRLESRRVLLVGTGAMQRQIATDLSSLGLSEVGLVNPTADAAVDGDAGDGVVEFDAASLDEAVAAADFVVHTASRPDPNFVSSVDEATQEHGTPWSSVRVHGFDGFVGPTIFPGETACFDCFTERTMANVSDPSRYRSFRQHFAERPEATQLRLPGLERMLAGYLVMDLVNLLAFGTGFTAGRVFVVDGTRLSVECNDVLKLPRCDTCGPETDAVSRFGGVSDIEAAAARFDGGDG
ncbi:TOMM precursor leader peptide-binding protein [Haloarcula sp. S1CR25-12]|uniref:TOMM leader peptide-binding protein n=1 Tax=Haloarcula saliterrae TaxID=2950534 RepID=A0ABU2FDK1_9EURY|nr:TOMM precursor leader peptide-binding protein [Haloarcula sp. S1CR25-12]MDS0260333.1 TOMM precursor leader peptide-binding protein [Haloarcula sp. S1CR25-12]